MENKIKITFSDGPKVEVNGDKKEDYFVEFVNSKTNKVIHSSTIQNNMWTRCSIKYHIPWIIRINGVIAKIFNLEGKKVKIVLNSKSVGDTLAWTPQVVEFAKKYKCDVTVATFHNNWFNKNPKYKNIKFVPVGDSGEYYAIFNVGWFMNDDGKWDSNSYHPILPNTIPLIQSATDILGLPYKEVNYGLTYKVKERPIEGKYICIAPHSTAALKEWPHHYWEELAGMLNDKGYKVVDISYEDVDKKNIINKPKLSWSNTYNYLSHADYYIGLGSGISWFNWAMDKPTLMINNFIPYGYEFTNKLTKVENNSVCNNCWVNPNFQFDRGDWEWCPINKNTPSHLICHKSIKPQKVFNTLSKLLEFK